MLSAPERSRTFIPCHTFPSHREADPESALMHYRARSYDPRVGRFVQKDITSRIHVEPNAYLYAALLPTRFGDPTGRAYWDLTGLERRSEENKGALRSFEWWKRVTSSGGALDTLLRKVIDELPGTAIWPHEFATVRGQVVHFAPEWSRESRATLYKSLYDSTTFRVYANTIAADGAAAFVSRLTEVLPAEVYVPGASWPGSDDDETAVNVAAFILIHELVHIAQKQGLEPVVDLTGPFAPGEMVERGVLFGVPGSAIVKRTGETEISAPFEPFAYFIQGRATAGTIQEKVKTSRILSWQGIASNARTYGVGLGAQDPFDWSRARWPENTQLHMFGVRRHLAPPRELLDRIRF